MSNYNSLKTAIDANIKQNGKQEITGPVLNSVLNAMVDTLGAGYQFAGIAVSDTNPGTPDAKVFYIANGKGAYTNFSGLDVTEDEVVVLYYDTEWHKVSTGIASQAKLSELQTIVDSKQDTISDLDTIRSNAAKGATALQSYTETDPVYSADKPSLALKSEIPDISGKQDKISDLDDIREGAELGKTSLQEHQDISGLATKKEVVTKQDKISDLESIREGAALGKTALQSYIESDPIYTADKPNLALKSELNGKQDKLTAGNGISIEGNVISSSVAEVVDNIVNAGYVFAGVATPATDPSTPNAKAFYIANGKGTYTNFGGLEVTEDEVAVLYYDTAWHKVSTGIASQAKLSELEEDIEEIYETKIVADKFTFGGTSNIITFDALSLTEDGDAIEFKVKCNPSSSAAYAFARNGNNIAISLSSAILGIKSSANEWQTGFNASTGTYNFGAVVGTINSTSKTFLLIREGASLKLYIDGTFCEQIASAPTITFDRLGGVHNGNYWSGELEFFRYIHNGATTELLDFPGYSATGDVTITTHQKVVGLLTEKVDKTPGKGLSTNDFTDEEKEKLEDIANSEAMKMTGDFITLLENQSLNDSGEQLTLPIIKQTGFARFSGVIGKIYTNAANMVKLLLKPGTITYNGVTLTIDENFWVTITGTANATGYICFNDLKWYAGLDMAKAAVTIPEMPSGNYRVGMTQRDPLGSSRQTIYIRSKTEASFLATLLGSSAINAEINMQDVGAMGALIISGTTYNERFRFMVMPSSVFSSLANMTEYNITDFPTNIRTIETDGIFKYENYTIGDGTASSIEKMLPVDNATKGVTCLWFGDSISELRNLPHLVGEKLAVNVIDVSDAGSTFTKTGSSKWYDTGVESLIEQKIANNFSPAETALSAQLADGNITQDRYTAKMANLESLENCDMSSIKKIVILAGTNDLSSSDLTLTDFKTGIANTLTNIFTEYPEIQVYCITPPYRTDADDVRQNGLVLADIVGAIIDVCKSFGVPCFDFLANCGVNSVNASHWIPDGLHPSEDGDEMFSTRIANWLKSIL